MDLIFVLYLAIGTVELNISDNASKVSLKNSESTKSG